MTELIGQAVVVTAGGGIAGATRWRFGKAGAKVAAFCLNERARKKWLKKFKLREQLITLLQKL